MAEREQKRRQAPSTRQEEEALDEAPQTSEAGERLKTELDELLDEIDEVLEENAEEFVRNYVQKGGE